jgi:hypothetical protein
MIHILSHWRFNPFYTSRSHTRSHSRTDRETRVVQNTSLVGSGLLIQLASTCE